MQYKFYLFVLCAAHAAKLISVHVRILV